MFLNHDLVMKGSILEPCEHPPKDENLLQISDQNRAIAARAGVTAARAANAEILWFGSA